MVNYHLGIEDGADIMQVNHLLREQYKKKFEDKLEEIKEKSKQYKIEQSKVWLSFIHTNTYLENQGWKIHIGVSILQATEMIGSVSDYCLRKNLTWKVLNSYKNLERSLYGGSGLYESGKQVTIYFNQAKDMCNHIEKLHKITQKFEGPKILTDKQYKRNSCIYYRYGAFKPEVMYNQFTGEKIFAMRSNSGDFIEDKRHINFYKPDWVFDPLEVSETLPSEQNVFAEKKLSMKKVLNQKGPGGVYLVLTEGKYQTLKEARKYMCTDLQGRDKRDRIRNEYTILKQLRRIQAVPEVFEMFNSEENTYITTEYFQGQTLSKYVETIHQNGEYNFEELTDIIQQIKDIVYAIHKEGIVHRDLSSENIIITKEKRVKIIDFENAYDISSAIKPFQAFTLGFVAKGLEREDRIDKYNDWFSIGAIIFFIATSIDMETKEESNKRWLLRLKKFTHTIQDKVLLDLAIQGIKEMERAISKLNTVKEKDLISHFAEQPILSRNSFVKERKKIIDYLNNEAHFTSDSILFNDSKASNIFSGISFSSGASGILFFLLNSYKEDKRESTKQFIIKVACWIKDNYDENKTKLPTSVYYGFGCLPELFIYTSDLLGIAEFKEKALEITKYINSRSTFQYNVSHGIAGLGLSFLNCYKLTGDRQYLELTKKVFDNIILGMEEECGLVKWKVFVKKLPDTQYYYPLGYFYGLAGIGMFVASYHKETQSSRAKEILQKIIHTLKEESVYNHSEFGVIWYRSMDHQGGQDNSWCNGTAGIVHFLQLAYTLENDNKSKELFEKGVYTLIKSESSYYKNQLNGLVGINHTLLSAKDLYDDGALLNNKINQINERLGILAENEEVALWTSKNEWGYSSDYMNGYTGIYDYFNRLYSKVTYPTSFMKGEI